MCKQRLGNERIDRTVKTKRNIMMPVNLTWTGSMELQRSPLLPEDPPPQTLSPEDPPPETLTIAKVADVQVIVQTLLKYLIKHTIK